MASSRLISGGKDLTLYAYAVLYDIGHGNFEKSLEQVRGGSNPSKPYAALTRVFSEGEWKWQRAEDGLESVVRSFERDGLVVKEDQTHKITQRGMKVLADAAMLILTFSESYSDSPSGYNIARGKHGRTHR